MNTYEFNSFDDFLKFCNNFANTYNNQCNNCKYGNKTAEADENSRCANSDIPGGFQDLDPQLLIIGTSILGASLASKMPSNVQNIAGNWLELLGQVILTFNSQQQYFQGGPGRIYDPIYRNASNPFCNTQSDESQRNVSTSHTSPKAPIDSPNLEQIAKTIDDLHKEIINLKREIQALKMSK